MGGDPLDFSVNRQPKYFCLWIWTGLLRHLTFGLKLLLFHTVPGGDSSISYTVVGNYRTLFLTTYITSVLSAAFGLAKCLKTGVARIIQSKGPVV